MFGLTMLPQQSLRWERGSAGGTGQRLRLVYAVQMGAHGVPRPEFFGAGGTGVAGVQMVSLHMIPQVGLRRVDVVADTAAPDHTAILVPHLQGHLSYQRVHGLCKTGEGCVGGFRDIFKCDSLIHVSFSPLSRVIFYFSLMQDCGSRKD